MRNFLYNKSDILVAVIIIVIALLIIWSRVDTIMDTDNYKPSTKATTTSEAKGADGDVSKADSDADSDTETDSSSDAATTPEPSTATPKPNTETTNPTEAQPTVFVIASGSSSGKVAEDLKAQGFISSAQEFIDMLKTKQVETKVKAGNFTIPAGATVEQIVEILTK
jgi:cytoskeletal protein RodZ